MRAMVLSKICRIEENPDPLEMVDLPVPAPGENEIVVKITACGVCHTELDEIEGRTPPPRLPVVLGHQVVGRVINKGRHARRFNEGDRVGVAWIYSSCGKCRFCLQGNENLCANFRATGRDANGGYAEYMSVPDGFAYPVPDLFSDLEAAPLLCAGTIGYRSLRLAGITNGETLGLVGFGASAHLVIQMAAHKYPDSPVFVFARTKSERDFALELGARWAGDMEDEPPDKIRAAIDTTPVWKPVVEALKNLQPGGRLVINAIRKEEVDKDALLRVDYPRDLWLEKEIKSVANVTRADVEEFLQLAAEIPIKPEVQEFSLDQANKALLELKQRKTRGAKVLRIG